MHSNWFSFLSASRRPVRPLGGKVYIETHGCQMNEHDSARMRDVLHDRLRMTATGDPEEADLLLLNTCSVREKAQEKVFSRLGTLARYKRDRPGALIGVGGCVASQEGDALRRRAPQVDIVFGPQTLHRLPELIEKACAASRRWTRVFRRLRNTTSFPHPRWRGFGVRIHHGRV